MKIVYFGTPQFSAIILETLIKHDLKPVLVVTTIDKPIGRSQIATPSPVKLMAEKHDILVIQPQDLESSDFQRVLTNIQPDLIVLVAYGPPFLSKEVLAMPKYGCLNLHPSLLPKYRGAAPIPAAILAGEVETGATIMRMSEKIDRGDILAQEKISIAPDETTKTLTEKLAILGGRLLAITIPLIIKGEISPQAQGESPTPYSFQLKKNDGKIDWQESAELIERQIRAFDPWPGTFTKLDGKILKILKTCVIKENIEPSKPGFVFLSKNKELAVQTSKDSLAIQQLQLAGGKPLSAEEFLHGHREIINSILE